MTLRFCLYILSLWLLTNGAEHGSRDQKGSYFEKSITLRKQEAEMLTYHLSGIF